jgi:hypothetical protein
MEDRYEEELLVQRPELFEGAIVAHLEAGDLFLWDDRTFHCNASGHPPRLSYSSRSALQSSAAWHQKVREPLCMFIHPGSSHARRQHIVQLYMGVSIHAHTRRAHAAWGASDPETARAARALALELGVDGGHDTSSSLRTLARVEERLAEIHSDRTWSIEWIDGPTGRAECLSMRPRRLRDNFEPMHYF